MIEINDSNLVCLRDFTRELFLVSFHFFLQVGQDQTAGDLYVRLIFILV